MAFPESVKEEALERAGNQCECKRISHNFHTGRCPQIFGLEFHHKIAVDAGGKDTLSNCEVLCEDCHKETESYGRH